MTIEDQRVAPRAPVITKRAVGDGLVQFASLGGISVITLNAPRNRNALSEALLTDLAQAIDFVVDEPSRALVLTGAGKVFCSGGDLEGVARALAGGPGRDIEGLVDQLHDVICRLHALRMPIVAAINGPAVGAGIGLAMAADVRVVADTASFVPGYLQVGASPDGGTSYHLARALGGTRALASLVLNRRLDAPTLLSTGIADVVVPGPHPDVVDAAVELATSLLSLSPPALAAVRALTDTEGGGLRAHLSAEKAHFLTVAQSAEFRVAMQRFAPAPSAAAPPAPEPVTPVA